MADKNKKKILVIGSDEFSASNYHIIDDINNGLKKYHLAGFPLIFGSSNESLLKKKLSSGKYGGVLIDERFLSYADEIKKKKLKFGTIIRDEKLETTNPEEIEKYLDEILS